MRFMSICAALALITATPVLADELILLKPTQKDAAKPSLVIIDAPPSFLDPEMPHTHKAAPKETPHVVIPDRQTTTHSTMPDTKTAVPNTIAHTETAVPNTMPAIPAPIVQAVDPVDFLPIVPMKTAAMPVIIENGHYKPGMGPYRVLPPMDIALDYPAKRGRLSFRITAPAGQKKQPVILWSHGLFGSQHAYKPLVEYWVSHGYIVIQPTHPDSRMEGTQADLRGTQALHAWDKRPAEISFIIDHLPQIERMFPELEGRIDRERIAAGGHSFGAHTSELLAGAAPKRHLNIFNRKRRDFSDSRIKAFVMVSPQGTSKLFDQKSFTQMTKPLLMVTGSNDSSPLTQKDFTWRLEAWRFAPPGDKYLLFIEGAWHGFGGIAGDMRFPGSGPQDTKHLDAVRTATLSFFDAQLKALPRAAEFLQSDLLRKNTQGLAQISTK